MKSRGGGSAQQRNFEVQRELISMSGLLSGMAGAHDGDARQAMGRAAYFAGEAQVSARLQNYSRGRNYAMSAVSEIDNAIPLVDSVNAEVLGNIKNNIQTQFDRMYDIPDLRGQGRNNAVWLPEEERFAR